MKHSDIQTWLNENNTKQLLTDLYPAIDEAQKRILECTKVFTSLFPNHNDINIFSSSGRVELCGNHTDHQGGLVLASAIHLDTLAIVSTNKDNVLQCISKGYDPIIIRLDDLQLQSDEHHSTRAILKGCLYLFSKHNPFSGLNIYIDGMIPSGSGLSSSASFECLILIILNDYFGKASPLSQIQIAQLAQRVENDYFSKPSGLLDQLCVTYGGMNMLDFRNEVPIITPIDFTNIFNDLDVCIIKTPDNHDQLTFAYKEIVDDNALISNHYQKQRLIEVNESSFYEDLVQLHNIYSSRSLLRAHHFFSENHRVLKCLKALSSNNILDFLAQLNASGHSSFEYLNNVIHPTSQRYNLAIGIALAQKVLQKHGAVRVHGGGFAGSILCISPKSLTAKLEDTMKNQFGSDCFILCKLRKHGVIRLTNILLN
jgi:galactokinase